MWGMNRQGNSAHTETKSQKEMVKRKKITKECLLKTHHIWHSQGKKE